MRTNLFSLFLFSVFRKDGTKITIVDLLATVWLDADTKRRPEVVVVGKLKWEGTVEKRIAELKKDASCSASCYSLVRKTFPTKCTTRRAGVERRTRTGNNLLWPEPTLRRLTVRSVRSVRWRVESLAVLILDTSTEGEAGRVTVTIWPLIGVWMEDANRLSWHFLLFYAKVEKWYGVID